MDKKLSKAAHVGDVDVLYSLTGESAKVLESFDDLSFVDNPLHIAAFEGQIHFAMEMMRLKPSLARKLNQDQFSPLHLALQNGKTQMVLRLIDIDRDLVRVQGREALTPLHHVAKEGNLELLAVFLSACPNSFEDVTIRNETALHIALKNDKVEAFEILFRWLTELCYEEVYQLERRILNWRDEDGNTLLHIAYQEIKSRTDQRLKKAAREGDIDALYELIHEDPCILDRIDQIPFIDTPMHIAASAGHTHFSMEIMRLKPTFSRKQNQYGFSPMHLALQNNKIRTVINLLSADRNLVRVKGREAKTPLHYVAEIGNVDLLAEFLAACPESIQDLTIRKETALHVAAKNDKLGAIEVLLGWLQHVDMDLILQWTDDEGNTALHIATDRNQFQMVKSLVNYRINVNAKNFDDLTALDIAKLPACDTEIKDLLRESGALGASSLPRVTNLAEFLTTKMTVLEKWITSTYLRKSCMSNENRNALLVVAVLIATATFQAVLSSPGGFRQGSGFNPIVAMPNSTSDQNQHSPFASFRYMAPWVSFLAFNTVAFLTSISEIWFHLPRGLYFLLKLVLPLLLCYMLSLSLTTPVSSVTPYYLILLLLSQWKAVARIIFFKRSLELKLHLLKHCPNLHKVLKGA